MVTGNDCYVSVLQANMNNYEVIFYIDNVVVEGGEIVISAVDAEQAIQVLLLLINNKQRVPSIFDRYSEPRYVCTC